jgi:imidazoleglycerol-phosphate dehydratase/histidinol-phosphatase
MNAPRPLLLLDRDGTLIVEPDDGQVDSCEKLALVDDVIPALLKLRDAGYAFVVVTNQDGLGTEAFPRQAFDPPHSTMLRLFESQGIRFEAVLIDTSFERENKPTRKPNIGLVVPWLQDRSVDWSRSAMVGDRGTDLEFARNLGVRGFQLRSARFGGEWSWPAVAHALTAMPRTAIFARRTSETDIRVALDLDAASAPSIRTGLGFFDHMLAQLGTHGGFAVEIDVDGDLDVDEHHTVEDTAIALGAALREALGQKVGIARYGFTLPMDEALASAALDLSGRACFVFQGAFRRERVGDLPTELVPHFFRSLCESAGMNLHLEVRGDNDHHAIEACFKAVARALGQAVHRERTGVPSSKGVL